MFTRVTWGGPNKQGVCVCVFEGGGGVGSLNQITGGGGVGSSNQITGGDVKISGGIGNFDKIKRKGLFVNEIQFYH